MAVKIKKKQACFLPGLFEPRGTNELIRLGSDHGGGYVVATDAVANSRYLISAGLHRNCEFEVDFAAMARLAGMRCYDASIRFDDLRKANSRARFLQLFRQAEDRRRLISFYRDFTTLFAPGGRNFIHIAQSIGIQKGELALNDALYALETEPSSIFVKCVLDGAEYDILDQVIENHERLSGLAITFHDVPARMREIEVFLTTMKDFIFLDNTTAVNSGGVNEAGIPNIVEISMSTKLRTAVPIRIAGATTKRRLLNAAHDPSKMDLEIVYV